MALRDAHIAADLRRAICLSRRSADLGMAGLDGIDTGRLIRQSEKVRWVKLVALSGWGQDQDRKRTCDAGFDLHLTKPASIDDLRSVLENLKPAKAHIG